MNTDSPIVEEVRQRRHEISARFDHDLKKYFAHLLEVQAKYQDRVVGQLRVVATAQAPVVPSVPAVDNVPAKN